MNFGPKTWFRTEIKQHCPSARGGVLVVCSTHFVQIHCEFKPEILAHPSTFHRYHNHPPSLALSTYAHGVMKCIGHVWIHHPSLLASHVWQTDWWLLTTYSVLSNQYNRTSPADRWECGLFRSLFSQMYTSSFWWQWEAFCNNEFVRYSLNERRSPFYVCTTYRRHGKKSLCWSSFPRVQVCLLSILLLLFSFHKISTKSDTDFHFTRMDFHSV